MVKLRFVDVDVNTDIPLEKSGFYVQFNPENMKIKEKSVKIQKSSSSTSQKDETNITSALQNKDEQSVTLTLHLLFNSLTSFDNNEDMDVRGDIQKFYKYSDPEDKKPRKIGALYGAMAIVGFITSFDVTYTAFNSQGVALRAEVDITIEGHHHGNVASRNFAYEHEFHQVYTSFAQSLLTYGDARNWKTIASNLNVKDPFHK